MRLRPWVIPLLSAVLLAACGGPEADGSAGTSPPPGSSEATGAVATATTGHQSGDRPQGSTGGATAASTSTGAAKGGSRVVQWIKDLGIMGGAGGDGPLAAYAHLADDKCADVLALDHAQFEPWQLHLYHGAATACLAAFHGQPARWSQAEAGYTAVAGRTGAFNCLEHAAFAILKSLVETHRADPRARLVRGAGRGTSPACPRVLAVVPDHGPATGGYTVRVIGEHLPDPATIEWSGTPIQVSVSGGREATVRVPPSNGSDAASVWVDGWPYGPAGSPYFTYEPAPTRPTN